MLLKPSCFAFSFSRKSHFGNTDIEYLKNAESEIAED